MQFSIPIGCEFFGLDTRFAGELASLWGGFLY